VNPLDQVISTSAGAAESRNTGKAKGLSKATMIGWGIGTIGPIMVLSAVNAFQLRFMTNFVGLSAGVASMLIVISKLYDSFADPAMGWISDHTVSRWGRRSPYLIAGGVILALSLVAMFTVPPFESTNARVVYTGLVLIFYATGYSIFNIPYMAMSSEMTSNFAERTELMSYRVYAVGLSQILAMFGGAALVQKLGGGAMAYTTTAILLSPLVLVSALICFWQTRHAPRTTRTHTHIPVWEQTRSVLSNRPYMLLIATKFVTLMTLSTQSIFPFFFSNILGASILKLGTYFLAVSVAFIVSQPVWVWMSAKWSKAVTYRFALLIAIPLWISWLWAGAGEPMGWIYLRGALIGFTGGGALLAGQAMLPDTMEYDYLRTGLRREGIFAGFYTIVEKLSGAVGIGMVGILLSSSGYIASRGTAVVQPQSALHAIQYICALLPAGLSLIGGVLMIFYDLTETKLAGLRADHQRVSG